MNAALDPETAAPRAGALTVGPGARRLLVLLAVGILTVAGALRFYGLAGKSLWLDEILTSPVMGFNSVGAVINWLQDSTNQMPAYPLSAWLLRGFGTNEVTLRLPSAFAGTLAVVAVFYLGRQVFGNRVAFVSAALMAVLPFAVVYSQEARAYALVTLASALQILFVYRARTTGRLVDWAAFTAASILNVYSHYVGIVATVAAFAYLGVSIAVDLLRRRARLLQAARAIASGAVVALLFVPWIHVFILFLRANNTALATYIGQSTSTRATVEEGVTLLGNLSLSGPVLVAVVLGVVALIRRAPADRDRSLLLLLWLAVPIAGFALVLKGRALGIEARYLSFLVPAAVVTAGVGVVATGDALTEVARSHAHWRWARLPSLGATVLAVVLVLVTIPPLVNDTLAPKQEFRAVVDHVIATSSAGSSIVALGQYSAFVYTGAGYYVKQRATDIEVVDGAMIDNRFVERVGSSGGTVWGAITFPTTDEIDSAARSGLVPVSYTGMLLVRTASKLPPLDQLRTLLEWDAAAQPAFASSVDVIDAVTASPAFGTNLLETNATWHLDENVTMTGTSFELRPGQTTLNAWSTTTIAASGRYVFDFSYRNRALRGRQLAVVSAVDAKGRQLTLYPLTPQFVCDPADDWKPGIIGFTVPAGIPSVTIWLRATGPGEADFDGVRLRPVL